MLMYHRSVTLKIEERCSKNNRDKLLNLNRKMYLFFSWNVDCSWSRFTDELVQQTNVSKCAPYHHLVVSSARTIRIEFFRCQAGNKDMTLSKIRLIFE